MTDLMCSVSCCTRGLFIGGHGQLSDKAGRDRNVKIKNRTKTQ
jgi:hypothetical protein